MLDGNREIRRTEAELQSKQHEKQEMKKATNVPIPSQQQSIFANKWNVL